MLNRDKLLEGLEDRDQVYARFLDRCERVLRHHEPELTPFLDPRQAQDCQKIVGDIKDLRCRQFGGYPDAERVRISIFPDYFFTENLDSGITILEIKPSEYAETISHRQYLGAILGLGIKRDQVGDLVLYGNGCQAVVTSEIADFVCSTLKRVDRFYVAVQEIDPEQLKVEPERVKEIPTTVASLRLDSVASSGFGTSRTKMARAIKQGRVKVNWEIIDDPAYAVDPQDILSIRGRGRVEIAEVRGESNRGRIKLMLKRYV